MSAGSSSEQEIPFRILKQLAAGGLSNATSSALLNWSDVCKIRMQTELKSSEEGAQRMYASFRGTFVRILREEGLLGLWLPGMVPSMMRELSYSSMRMGLYTPIRNAIAGKDTPNEEIGLSKKILAGLMTGSLGSAIATPTDLVKIRQQQEAGRLVNGVYTTGLRKGLPPSYPNTIAMFAGIYQQSGIQGLYQGALPTIARAALLTSAQMATYDEAKKQLKNISGMKEGPRLHVTCSLIASLVACTACAPADLVKSRWMCDPDRKLYSSPFDCAVKTVQNGGPLALFRGWVPSYYRIAPHFIIALSLLEQFRRLFGLGYLS